uniref:MFS domain-containing protein n=1 Tax=Caenorhabditis japonica TaxID=281687 RepID=A0A8R1DYF9_CAEJA
MLIEPAPFHSMVQDFEMFCGTEAYNAAWVATIQFIGVLVGAIVYGHLGDHFGRKPVSLFGIAVGIGFGVASGFAPSWQLFATFRFVVGTSIASILIVFYAYILEFIEPEQRVFLRSFFNWGYARLIFTLVCFLCGYWRSAAIATSLLTLPVLPVILLLPESPKWYTTKNRLREAREAEKRVAWLSGVSYGIEEVDKQGEEKPETEKKVQDTKIYTMRDLFTSWPIAYRTIVVGSLWFSTSLSAFGSDLNSGNLSGNFYMSQFVSAAVTAFAKIFVFLLDTYWPSFDRRRLHQFPQIAMIACYAAIMVLMVLPESDCAGQGGRDLAIIIVNIIGVSFIEITWDACYLVAVECFPTKIRTIGIGTCSLLARTGALLAPQMAYLSDIYRPAPYAVVCSIGTISLFISCFFLPNTKGVDLSALDPTEELDYNRKKSVSENIAVQRRLTLVTSPRVTLVDDLRA